MSASMGNSIPAEIRLPLYLSARHLQELEPALRLVGIRVRYERPGAGRIMLPRLAVAHPEHGELRDVICATPQRVGDRKLAWWFEWRSFAPFGCSYRGRLTPARICRAMDMNEAARIIAAQLREGRT